MNTGPTPCVWLLASSLLVAAPEAAAETMTYLRRVEVTGRMTYAQAKRAAQRLDGPTALVFSRMPPGARLVRKGPGFMEARTVLGQRVTEHISAVREGDRVFIVGAARTRGAFPGTGALAAAVHMLYTSPTRSARKMTGIKLPGWRLKHLRRGESPAYRAARKRHYRQKADLRAAAARLR